MVWKIPNLDFPRRIRFLKSNKKFRFAKFFITQLFIRNCFHWESEVGWGSGQGSGISRGSLEIGFHPPIHPLYPRSSPIHPRSPDAGSPSIPIQPGVPIDPGVPIRSPPRGGLNLEGGLGSMILAKLSIMIPGCVSCSDTSKIL